jgi:hypothetical protein
MKKARKIPVLSILLFMLFANTLALAVEEYASNGLWEYGQVKEDLDIQTIFIPLIYIIQALLILKMIIALGVLEKQENGQKQDIIKYHQLD